jgi:hypothetical protein
MCPRCFRTLACLAGDRFGDIRRLPPLHMRKPGYVIAVDFSDQEGDTA